MTADENGWPTPPAAGRVLGRDPRPALPKRFFGNAHVALRTGGFALVLDGRGAKTPARRDLMLPTEPASAALAEEWNALGETIDPRLMPLTRLANAAIDGVAGQMAETRAEVCQYFRSDLLVYRAEEPAALVEAQSRAWDPLLDWCREAYGAHFRSTRGIVFAAQAPEALAAMDTAVAEALGIGAEAPFRLAALNVMTVLTGSAILAFAVLAGRIEAGEAWAAAHVDEMFQEARWGEDAEALARRAARWLDMRAAASLGRMIPRATD